MGNIVTAGVHECKIISGGCFGSEAQQKYIIGGWAWSWCLVSQVDRMSLRIMTLKPSITSVETSEGVAVSCDGVAQVSVMKDSTMLALAAEQFVGMPDTKVEEIILQTIEGHFRSILGTMTVEQIFSDREGFANRVRETAGPDVAKMGIKIISFVIKDVADQVDYLKSLGVRQVSATKRNAEMGVASAAGASGIACSEAMKVMMETKFKCDALIAHNRRCYELKQAEHDQEVSTHKAEAELAYELQGAQVQQNIKEEKMEIDLVERRKQIDIEEQEVSRKEKELFCSKRAPAEAEAKRLTILAEAERVRTLCYASAESTAIKAIGTAEAYQIELIGKAEAEQMRQKAAAFSQYGDAAIISLILDALPKIAAEVASPMACIGDIVIVSRGEEMSDGVRRLLGQLPPSLQAITALDISQSTR